ncbi:MAG: hypothetical protein C5B59_16855 [Bacteroidetes bacterium]|nr:MAG: hypothetical protein C5B59_16855 [Bacteroidota bacterium]
MKVALTNLSNSLYEQSRHRLNDSARKFGITEVYSYDFNDIKSSNFYKENQSLLDQPRGLGYWLWKPYLVLEAFQKLNDGDVVIYSDSGIEIIDHVDPLVRICTVHAPIMLFGNSDLVNFTWTKRDCFILMNADNPEFWYSLQCDAAFVLFRKSDLAIRFLKDWLVFGSDQRIISDMPNTCGKKNLFGYIEHRWDQSILSILARQYNLPFFRMPTQFGNHYKMPGYQIAKEFNCVSQVNQAQVDFYVEHAYDNSPYFQLLNHHRSTNRRPDEVKKNSLKKKIERRIQYAKYNYALSLHQRKIKEVRGW